MRSLKVSSETVITSSSSSVSSSSKMITGTLCSGAGDSPVGDDSLPPYPHVERGEFGGCNSPVIEVAWLLGCTATGMGDKGPYGCVCDCEETAGLGAIGIEDDEDGGCPALANGRRGGGTLDWSVSTSDASSAPQLWG